MAGVWGKDTWVKREDSEALRSTKRSLEFSVGGMQFAGHPFNYCKLKIATWILI